MVWLRLIAGLAFAGASLGLAVGYFDAEVLDISEEAGKAMFKICGVVLLIDIVVILVASLFNKKP